MTPMGRRIQTTLAVIGVTVLTLVVWELAARAVIFLADDVFQIGLTERLAESPAFDHVEYDGAALLAEQEHLPHTAYEPYALWKARPWAGQFFHVGHDGFRLTSTSSDDPDAFEVWMLGGSTVFGYGAPDGETIPSHLAPLLADRLQRPVKVRNLGQGGYVSFQEGALLLVELARGEAPDLVIFYDGYNDAVAAKTFPEAPAPHFQLDRIRARFESPMASVIFSSGTFRLVDAVTQRWASQPGFPRSPEDTRRLGRRGADIRKLQHQAALALGRERGFRVETFLQPARSHAVLEAMREVLVAQPLAHFHDLGDVFSDLEVPVYIDDVHVTGVGNARVARQMLDDLDMAAN